MRRGGAQRALWVGVSALLCTALLWTALPWAAVADEVRAAEAAPQSTADRRLLDSIYEQHGIDGRANEPDAGLYFQDLGRALGDSVTSWLDRHLGTFASATSAIIGPVAYGLLLLLAVASLALWGRILWRRRGASGTTDPSLQRLDTPRPGGEAQGAAVTWEAQLRQAIDADDVPEAMEALWWWLAEALDTVADAAWTSRELVLRAGRRDLLPQVRRLDRLIYSSGQPAIGDVVGLWDDLQRRVTTSAGGEAR